MIHLILTLNNLQKPVTDGLVGIYMKISNLFDAFMNSNFMKAWEEAARKRAQYYEAQYTINELSRLTDKELADIGISRGEIRDIAYNSTYRS